MRTPISAWHEKYRPLLAGEGFARFAEESASLAFLRVDAEADRRLGPRPGRLEPRGCPAEQARHRVCADSASR